MNLRHVFGGLATAVLMICAAPAMAAQVQWTLQPATFSDNSHLIGGSFIFDTVSGNFSSISIQTDHGTYVDDGSGSLNHLVATTTAGPFTAGTSLAIRIPGPGNNFGNPQTNAVVNVTEGTCADTGCTGTNNLRNASVTLDGVSPPPPPPPPTPTLGEWAMVMFAVLVSGAGLYAVRRSSRTPARAKAR